MRKTFLLPALLFSCSLLQAQQKTKHGWHLLDKSSDGYQGISLAGAYKLLQSRSSQTVVVAVIDSGVDTLQEDLKANLWVNPKEVSGNGVDDDGNGYVDDRYGWNFCGSKTGENLQHNSHEATRVYHGWKEKFSGKKEHEIAAADKFMYSQWLRASDVIESAAADAEKNLVDIDPFLEALQVTSKVLVKHLGKDEFNYETLSAIGKPKDEQAAKSQELWLNVFSRGNDKTITQAKVIEEVSGYRTSLQNSLDRRNNKPVDNRGALTQDKYTDINDRIYGNNNLRGSSGDHGTMVAATIAAVRENSIGMDGIAANVRIMSIRAVPGGDEHDKDVALAIRYAVDNGASIINMSFGKPVSPYKHMVDDAVRYAQSKGVLLVHGSGNDGKDVTEEIFYPNAIMMDGSKASNFITVGASGDEQLGGLAASFSNYSKRAVDIFAPGVQIYSAAPDNRYHAVDGTSFSAPVVSGVAALLKSYFPKLTPEQLIDIMMRSATPIKTKVTLPGSDKKTAAFQNLSVSGGIINAAKCVQLALEMEQKNGAN